MLHLGHCAMRHHQRTQIDDLVRLTVQNLLLLHPVVVRVAQKILACDPRQTLRRVVYKARTGIEPVGVLLVHVIMYHLIWSVSQHLFL